MDGSNGAGVGGYGGGVDWDEVRRDNYNPNEYGSGQHHEHVEVDVIPEPSNQWGGVSIGQMQEGDRV